MRTAPTRAFHLTEEVVCSLHARSNERILAHGLAYIRGKSRTQVLGSGGRVAKGVTSEARSLDGTDDSGRSINAHRARSETEADSGGLKLSRGRASNSGCRVYPPSIPSQGEMTYG
jgi:hypothetical protein